MMNKYLLNFGSWKNLVNMPIAIFDLSFLIKGLLKGMSKGAENCS